MKQITCDSCKTPLSEYTVISVYMDIRNPQDGEHYLSLDLCLECCIKDFTKYGFKPEVDV